jgi:hypothetical protein
MDESLAVKRKRCNNCVSLRKNQRGEWMCDDADAPIAQVVQCSEWENQENGG